jgi:low affinity Fe/Cu permease
MRAAFKTVALGAAEWMGSPWAFVGACTVLVAWGATGPAFHFSDRWQLVITTGTSVVVFLMVFLIQYSQNRDVVAIQLKLDELIRAVDGARTHLVQLEDMSDEELARLQVEFQRLQAKAQRAPEAGAATTLASSPRKPKPGA